MEVETLPGFPSSHSSVSAVSCRICKYSDGPDLVASPCLCKGSMGAVHVTCLEEWLTGSSRVACELCETPFNVVRTRKYGCLQSMWVFLRDYVNPVKFSRDIFFLTVSLMNASILLYMWVAFVYQELAVLHGVKPESGGAGMSHQRAYQRLLYFLFFTTCLVFVCANAVDDFLRVLSVYGRRWYRWWQLAVDVKLVLEQEDAGDKTKLKNE